MTNIVAHNMGILKADISVHAVTYAQPYQRTRSRYKFIMNKWGFENLCEQMLNLQGCHPYDTIDHNGATWV
jgi:hypothetical protein